MCMPRCEICRWSRSFARSEYYLCLLLMCVCVCVWERESLCITYFRSKEWGLPGVRTTFCLLARSEDPKEWGPHLSTSLLRKYVILRLLGNMLYTHSLSLSFSLSLSRARALCLSVSVSVSVSLSLSLLRNRESAPSAAHTVSPCPSYLFDKKTEHTQTAIHRWLEELNASQLSLSPLSLLMQGSGDSRDGVGSKSLPGVWHGISLKSALKSAGVRQLLVKWNGREHENSRDREANRKCEWQV
jgi:hypothetical protein